MDVEVALCPGAGVSAMDLKVFLESLEPSVLLQGPQVIETMGPEYASAIASIRVYGSGSPMRIHCYELHDNASDDNIVDNDGERLSVAIQTILPAVKFDGEWDSLIYDKEDTDDKETLLNFMRTMVAFG